MSNKYLEKIAGYGDLPQVGYKMLARSMRKNTRGKLLADASNISHVGNEVYDHAKKLTSTLDKDHVTTKLKNSLVDVGNRIKSQDFKKHKGTYLSTWNPEDRLAQQSGRNNKMFMSDSEKRKKYQGMIHNQIWKR